MNKTMIIGNLTRDPELRSVQGQDGPISVCDFTVAVNRKQRNQGQQEADFFRVTAWRGLGETCRKYLAKGRKVCVTGPVSLRLYTGNDNVTRGSLEITAEDVEFLSPKEQQASPPPAGQSEPEQTVMNEEDELPF